MKELVAQEKIKIEFEQRYNHKFSVQDKNCETCIKADVCRLKEEMEDLRNEVGYNSIYPEDFEIAIKCKRWAASR